MASIECLREATKEIQKATTLDEDTKKWLNETVQDIVNSKIYTEEQMKARMLFVSRELKKQAYMSQVSRQFDDMKMREISAWLDTLPEENRAQALRNWLEDSWKYSQTETASLSSRLSSEERWLMGQLNPVFDAVLDPRKPWIADSAFAKTFHQELRGVDTGDARAKKLAQQFRSEIGKYISRLREAGVYVDEINDWGPQTHAPSIIMSDYNNWRQFLIENLHPKYHPDPETTVDVVYRSLMTRDLQDQDMSTISMSRQLKFKNPQAEYDYFNRYGDSHFAEALYHNVRSMARKTVLAEQAGPSARANIDRLIQNLQEESRVRETSEGGQSLRDRAPFVGKPNDVGELERARMITNSLTGALQNPANQNAAHWMGAARNWMVTQMLGQTAILLGTQDSLISVMGGRFHTGGFGSAMTEQIRNFKNVLGKTRAREYAEELGYWTTALHMAAVDRFSTPFGTSETTKGIAGQSATATQRLTGTYYLEAGLRSASALTVSRAMGKNLSKSWDQLDKRYRKMLGANGFDKNLWDRLRSQSRTNDMGAIDVKALPRVLREHVLSAINREVSMMVVYPDHYSRSILTAGAQAGTLPGEAAAAATQFMSWPVQFVRGPMAREMSMGGTGFVGFSAGMMAAGVLTEQLYAAAKDEPMFEWDSAELWTRAASRSGLLTPVGDALLSQRRFGDFGMGPIFSTSKDVVNLGWKAFDAAAFDASNSVAREAVQLAEEVAVPNMWWLQLGLTRPAMDYAMWELDPEYMQDRQRRWREEGRDL